MFPVSSRRSLFPSSFPCLSARSPSVSGPRRKPSCRRRPEVSAMPGLYLSNNNSVHTGPPVPVHTVSRFGCDFPAGWNILRTISPRNRQKLVSDRLSSSPKTIYQVSLFSAGCRRTTPSRSRSAGIRVTVPFLPALRDPAGKTLFSSRTCRFPARCSDCC